MELLGDIEEVGEEIANFRDAIILQCAATIVFLDRDSFYFPPKKIFCQKILLGVESLHSYVGTNAGISFLLLLHLISRTHSGSCLPSSPVWSSAKEEHGERSPPPLSLLRSSFPFFSFPSTASSVGRKRE